ncbi:MAG TPA: M20 family metallopeptidase [Clostridia bacterium]|nr:M20 family metallopeptidase [Clostridia bacterium]
MDIVEHKQKLYALVDDMRDMLIEINDFIHDNPETGNNEVKAYKLITEVLAGHGFAVDKEVIGLATAFRATYKIGEGGPKIGLLCEYDALEGLGHGCGHNLQAPAIIGAALALAQELGDSPAEIIVFGTPAEETTSGKLPMTKAGIFDDLDVALMMHASDRTTVDGKSLAVNLVDFIFEGKAAHAAIAPERGISALDAVLMTFNGIEYLREHMRSDVRIHGIITDGGIAANIVPERAAAQFYIRANDRPHLDTVVERVYNVAKGMAMAVGARLTINEVKAYDNKMNVETLNQILLAEVAAAGAKDITPPRTFTGSTDFSCVTYRVPGACLRVSFVPFDTPSHSQEWVEAAKSQAAYEAVVVTAKAIAGACYDLVKKPELLQRIKQEFVAAKQASK